jgi:type IV pilus assembly protein PilN
MIEINLLPHREARRAAELRETLFAFVAGLVAVGLGIFFFDSRLNQELETEQATADRLQREIAEYRSREKQVADFKRRKAEVETKLDVIRGLEVARSGPVRILDELAKETPERLWLTHFALSNGVLEMRGSSLDNVVVADFLRALGRSEFFENVNLIKTERGSPINGVRLVQFELKANFTSPDGQEKAKSSPPAGA